MVRQREEVFPFPPGVESGDENFGTSAFKMEHFGAFWKASLMMRST